MAISKEEVLEAISSMSVLDLSELIKEMEEKFREELRRMKEMMEQEIAEQRILAQRQMAQTEGKGSDVPQPSMAGDLEDDEDGNDDDDLLHDRESWGRMRKSRKELEDLCNELQDSLRKKDEALNELKKDADQKGYSESVNDSLDKLFNIESNN